MRGGFAGTGQGFRRAARLPDVTDLGFGPDGSLWIGSLTGLWRLSVEQRLEDRSPAPGAPARIVNRVSFGGGLVGVATDAGAWLSGDGVRWRRLLDGSPTGPVAAISLAPLRKNSPAASPERSAERDGQGPVPTQLVDVWLVASGDLWRFEAIVDPSSPGGVALSAARRVRIPGAPNSVLAVDLTTDIPGAAIAVVYPELIAVARDRAPNRAGRVTGELGLGSSEFEILRPALPPGARVRRIAAGAGGVWLATDAGLLHAAKASGPWRRSEVPAGSASTSALAISPSGESVLAVGGAGLLSGSPVLRASVPALDHEDVRRVPVDPGIYAVHRASLRYLELKPERMRGLREGLARRGWLPELSLRFDASEDWDRNWDYDEAFLSGQTRRLNDRDRDRSRSLDASIVLSWDFGDVAFDADSIDLSREARLVISLRDSVLDEINQLYFERRGLLHQLGMSPYEGGPDPMALELRAAELAAGLDAWTGGWFSSAVAMPAERQE